MVFQPETEITAEQRAVTKQIVYGILYGMYPTTLAKKLKISIEDAKQLIETFLGFYKVGNEIQQKKELIICFS